MLYYYLAYCLEQKGDGAEAEKYYEVAPTMPGTYCFPYRLESIHILRHAMERDPGDGRAPYYLGNLLYDRQPDAAVESWETARAIDPNQATLQRNLGFAYSKKNEIDKAIASYEASVQCNSDDPRVFYEAELIYEKAGVDPKVRLALLDKNPDTVFKRDDLIARRIELQVQAGRYDDAIDTLSNRTFDTWEGGGGIHDVYVNARILRGLAALHRNNVDAGLADLVAALDYPANLGVDRPGTDPKAARTEYLIGLACESKGDAGQAQTHFETAAGTDVQTTDYRYYKGQALRKLGKDADAQALFDALIADGTKELEEGGNVDFFAAFGEKVSHDKRMANAHYTIGLGLLGKEQTDEAGDHFAETLKLDPNHLWVRELMSGIAAPATNRN